MKYLESTGQYAARSVGRLTGGYSNFVYRAHLKEPLPSGRTTVVVKHAQSSVHVSGHKELALTTVRQVRPLLLLLSLSLYLKYIDADITI